MKKNVFMCLVASLFLLLAACSTTSDDKEANAKENENTIAGKLKFYTSQPDEDVQKLVDAFNEKHPDVEVEVFRSGTEEVINKVLAEKKAGDVQADVLLVADAVTFENLKKQSMLMSYESVEASAIPDQFKDIDNTYTGTKAMATALIINTKNTKETISSWADLTTLTEKGQIIMPSPLYSGAAAYNLGVLTRDHSFGWPFYEQLKELDAIVTKGNGAVLKSVASGESNYGMIVDFLAARAMKDGSPVELVYPKEGVPIITEPIGIMSNTKNEKAAKALVDFVLSEEGQKLSADIGYTPIREGVEAPEGLKNISEIKTLDAPVELLYEKRNQDKEDFEKLFGSSARE